jgi:hypothetical protein
LSIIVNSLSEGLRLRRLWTGKAVSRKATKYSKVAKQGKDFAFAVLRAFATLRELF